MGQNCIEITTNSMNVKESETQSHIGKCVAMLQTLKQTLRKMKDAQTSGLGTSAVIQALLVNKPERLDSKDGNENDQPFLIDML